MLAKGLRMLPDERQRDLLSLRGEALLAQFFDSIPIKTHVLDPVQPTDEIASADVFAPVSGLLRVSDISAAIEIVNRCPYRLAASVFGAGKPAEAMAAQLEVGTVCINDLIVPTADPRLPFGGRGKSGFGVTRGRDAIRISIPMMDGQDSDGLQHKSFYSSLSQQDYKYMTSTDGVWE